MKKKQQGRKRLFNMPSYKAGEGKPKLLRIISTSDYTKVDFGYQSMRYYIKGGWVRMSKDTFIRIKETGEKLQLVKADNIPIAPAQHHFESNKDWLYYSLYFPALPNKIKSIDLIENENGSKNDFNYVDIEIDSKSALEII